tara:strand:- start:980 stop:1630 length:651 start_codon:yes stop_codon:yes gene_type:complete
MNKADYAVFFNRKKNKKLVYYPVAKNANSSTKLFLLRHLGVENKFYFIEDTVPGHLTSREMIKKFQNKNNLTGFLPPYTPFKKMDVDIKCCIVRDPIQRFISAYKNRIIFHKDKQFKDHSINLILEKLENKLFENKHFLPQNYWLGYDLSYFTFVGQVNKMSSFINNINDFFEQKKEFPKIQTGGKESKVKLNSDQIKKIKIIYEKDYFLLRNIKF